MLINTLGDLFNNSVKNFGPNRALGYVGEKAYSYNAVNCKVKSLIAYFESKGIAKGDKIAIFSSNQPNWGIAYFAIVSMGAIAVPILPDFHEDEIENIIDHSESKALMVSANLYRKIKQGIFNNLQLSMLIDNFTEIQKDVDVDGLMQLPSSIDENNTTTKIYSIERDDLASIIYTSGTTGKSKGVMLSHWNLVFTVLGSMKMHFVKDTDRILSLLPLSHTLENTVAFILPFYAGASIWYMKKLPTPAVLLPALQIVKPTIVLSVPLIIEKIYKGKILPEINGKTITRFLYKFLPTRKLINKVAGKKLMHTFGGELEFFGIGGAKLDPTVEQFMIDSKFPYAIGYGLTETAPILAGFDVYQGKFQSTGPAMDGVTLKINEPNTITGEGEIWAKGDNVMKGYYKEPELTAEVITPDGWFRTGDLGCFDKSGFLFIKGRLKNMIVGASGENIYPEDIEAVINQFKYVLESVVIQKKGKLVAMVHFNREELDAKFLHLKEQANQYVDKHIEELLVELKYFVNSKVNKFSRIQVTLAHIEPFEKTATKKIKRFLYS